MLSQNAPEVIHHLLLPSPVPQDLQNEKIDTDLHDIKNYKYTII